MLQPRSGLPLPSSSEVTATLSVVLKLYLLLAVGGASRSHPNLAFPLVPSEKLLLAAAFAAPLAAAACTAQRRAWVTVGSSLHNEHM